MKKIALPVNSDNHVDGHFGHCDSYSIYTVSENNEVIDVQTLKSEQGCGCKSNIASVLAAQGVTLMLAGGIGNGAINVLNNSGIEVIRGCSGAVSDVVDSFIKGTITDSGVSCAEHDHHHGDGKEHQCSH